MESNKKFHCLGIVFQSKVLTGKCMHCGLAGIKNERFFVVVVFSKETEYLPFLQPRTLPKGVVVLILKSQWPHRQEEGGPCRRKVFCRNTRVVL